MNIEDYAKENHYRTRNLHDGRPVPPAAVDRKKRSAKEQAEEALRLGEDRCTAIVGEQGYVFEQDGKLDWLIFRRRSGSFLIDSVQTILSYSTVCTLDQLGDLEAAGTASTAAIGHVLEAIKVRRIGRGNPVAKGRSKEHMDRIRKLRGSN